jgi:hypothetical protein
MATRPSTRAWWKPRERQVEFPPMQTHPRIFELGLLVLNVVLIVVVLLILWGHPSGAFIGPWG